MPRQSSFKYQSKNKKHKDRAEQMEYSCEPHQSSLCAQVMNGKRPVQNACQKFTSRRTCQPTGFIIIIYRLHGYVEKFFLSQNGLNVKIDARDRELMQLLRISAN